MQLSEARRAVAAARSLAAALGLGVDDAVVLNDSNRLVVRLLPCDVVARVSLPSHPWMAAPEVELVRLLAATDAPVAPLDGRVEPRVHEHEGFAITLWMHVEPVAGVRTPGDYADALAALHAALRQIDVAGPHVLDRVTAARRDVERRDLTPDLTETDRALLVERLQGQLLVDPRRDQLLHGEPHPWNVLDTSEGLRFIDFENAARGPVEYDLAWVPKEVTERYPSADLDLVDHCRGIVLAIIAMHRWRVGDEHPSGRASGVAFLGALRSGPPWPALDDVTW